MFCPETVVFDDYRHLCITRHEKTDYGGRHAPLPERLNPLRYSITIRRNYLPVIHINRDGRLARHFANFNWWLWKRHFRHCTRVN